MITISLRETCSGQWLIERDGAELFCNMALDPAIALARDIAAEEFRRTGITSCVEIPGLFGAIRLALHSSDAGADLVPSVY